MRGRALRQVHAILCTGLAGACLWFAFDEWRSKPWINTPAIVVFLFLSAIFAATALSVVRRWRAMASLSGVSGAVLILYALAVVTMGWEDVGGARGAIPLALVTGLIGVLSVAVAVGAGPETGKGERDRTRGVSRSENR